MTLPVKFAFSSMLAVGLSASIFAPPSFADDTALNVLRGDVSASSLAQDDFYESSSDVQAYQAEFDRFIPKPQKSTKIDYTFWDGVIFDTIIDLGPSDRIRRVKPRGFFNGKRYVEVGHTSPFRLEGSLIGFSEAYEMLDLKRDIHAYRKELEQLATDIDITTLSRDEQLAFWFNLHNVAVYDILLQRRLKHDLDWYKIKGQRYDDAKVLNINGAALSLKDIRHNIVYRNWEDPVVMYGFFHGYIGGPSLRPKAYTAENLKEFLQEGAEEFTNSLRGFEVREGRQGGLQVSQLYSDAAAVYFPNFQQDLQAHFKKYMRPEIFKLTNSGEAFKTVKFDTDVSDLRAGKPEPKIAGEGSLFIDGFGLDDDELFNLDPGRRTAYAIFEKEVMKKRDRLIDLGLLDNEVTIEDVETEDSTP